MLSGTNQVIPYLHTHKVIVKQKNLKQPKKHILNEHKKTFMTWFKDEIMKDSTTFETLMCLTNRLNSMLFLLQY